MLAIVGVLLVCVGCAPQTTPADTDVASEAPPLACDELIPIDLITAALTGSTGPPEAPRSAVQPRQFDPFNVLVPAAGGLLCSWGSGSVERDTWRGDWAYFSVKAIPITGEVRGAGLGTGPLRLTESVAGFDAAAQCNDELSACVVAAPVDGIWVEVRVESTPLTTTEGRFSTLESDLVLERLGEAAAAAFSAIAAAESAGGAWPTPSADLGAHCDGIGTAEELELKSDPVRYTSFSSVALERIGAVRCAAGRNDVIIAPGAGDSVREVVLGADFDSAFPPLAVDGAEGVGPIAWLPGGSLAYVVVGDDGYVIIGPDDIVPIIRDIVEAPS